MLTLNLQKVAHMSMLQHLPLRWLVNGESKILEEHPIMLMEAFRKIDSDHPTLWRRTFRTRKTHAGRIESVFREVDEGILEMSATLNEMLDKGIQMSAGPDIQRLLNSIAIGNRQLSKVSNRKCRRILTHKESLQVPSRPWQELRKAPINHRHFLFGGEKCMAGGSAVLNSIATCRRSSQVAAPLVNELHHLSTI